MNLSAWPGTPRKLTRNQQGEARRLSRAGLTAEEIAGRFEGVSTSAIYRSLGQGFIEEPHVDTRRYDGVFEALGPGEDEPL